jgi:hypothetical protein
MLGILNNKIADEGSARNGQKYMHRFQTVISTRDCPYFGLPSMNDPREWVMMTSVSVLAEPY